MRVARLEAEVLLSEMARRVETIELDGEALWRPGNALRMLETLPLSIRPA
jgi:cytochrome P450